MKQLPAEHYFYSHGKHPRILQDIPELLFTAITPEMNPMSDVKVIDNDLYVNTWIGRDGKYVLPGIGCTVEELYKMHNDMMAPLDLKLSVENPYEYIPSINYKYYAIEDVDFFVWDHREKKILFCNGNCHSSQAENFDFTPVINAVAESHKDYAFIITQDYEGKPNNVYATSEIINRNLGFDLNEISYLSRFCDVIIGRNSGPHVFSQVRENWADDKKTLISFTYKLSGASFVLTDKTSMKKKWSSLTDFYNVKRIVEETIDV